MGIVFFDPCHIVGMNTGIERAVQPGLARSIQLFEIITEEVAQLLAAIDRLAIRCCAIDHCRQRFNELPERSLSLPQCLLDAQLIVDVMRQTIPLDDPAALVPQRLGAAFHPAIDAIGAPQAILGWRSARRWRRNG